MRDELTIMVNKTQLLDALQRNRTAHKEAFEKAKAGYIKVTRRELEKALETLDRGEMLHRILSTIPPEDHTGDYDDAIAMMEWSRDDQIQLTQSQFRQYVNDDWGWKRQWTTSNSVYLEG